MKVKKIVTAISASLVMAFALPLATFAASTVVVAPTNQQGWVTADTRPGGEVNFVNDASAPSGSGALQLKTNVTTTSKAQYMHSANVSLNSVNDLSYYTKQNSAPFPGAAASYQLPTLLGGTTGFTTLVFEPYQNSDQGPVVPGVWQQWDVDQGFFWSSKTVTCSEGTIVGTPGGPASYTLAQIKTACPSASVLGFGANIGSNNPLYDVETDLFNFNGTTYDFEVKAQPASKDDCKKDGYQNLVDSAGNSFKNQGQCVSSVAKNKL